MCIDTLQILIRLVGSYQVYATFKTYAIDSGRYQLCTSCQKRRGRKDNGTLYTTNTLTWYYQPLYGYACSGTPKFRKTSVANTDVYFTQDDELDFDTILSKPLPKIPLDVTFTAHWLAIEGVQPAIPQNPTPGGMLRQ